MIGEHEITPFPPHHIHTRYYILDTTYYIVIIVLIMIIIIMVMIMIMMIQGQDPTKKSAGVRPGAALFFVVPGPG